MHISYYEIERFLDKSQEKKLIEIALSVSNWMEWKSSKSGNTSYLKFYDPSLQFIGRKCWLMMLRPNEVVEEHTDVNFRNTVLIYPLTENYAPCNTKHGSTDKPILLNTQMPHSVRNNNHIRINLQVLFDEDLEDAIQIFNSRTTNKLTSS